MKFKDKVDYKNIFDRNVAYFLIDQKGMVLEMSERCYLEFHFSRKEPTKKPFFDVFGLNFSDAKKNKVLNFLQQKEDYNFIAKAMILQKEAELKFSFQKITSKDKQFLFFCFPERTEKKTSQEQVNPSISISEKRAILLANSTLESITLLNQGICFEANRATTDLLGYSYEELIGMHASQVIAPEYREIVKNNILNKYELPYEVLAQKKDGSTFWAEIRGKMILYEGKEIRITSLRDISIKKEAEIKLHENENKFRILFEKARIPLILYDHEKIIDVNQAAIVFFKMKSKADFFQPIDPTFSPEFQPDGRKSSEGIKNNIETIWGKGEYEFNWTYKLNNGELATAEVKALKLFINQQIVFLLQIYDLTHLRKIEQELLSNRLNLYSILNNAGFNIWALDKNYQLLAFNESFQKQFEYLYGKKPLPGVNLIRQSNETLNQIFMPLYHKAFKGKKFVEEIFFENEYYELSFNPIKKGKEVLGVSVFSKLITHRKLAIEALKESNRLLEEAQELAKLGFWALDLDTQKLTWSRQIFISLGLSPEELEPKISTYMQVIHPEDWPLLERKLTLCTKTGKPFELELRHQHKDGSYKWMYTKTSAIKNKKKKVIALNGIIQDIDERKKSEQKIRENENRLNVIFNTLGNVGVYQSYGDIDSPTRFTYVSKNFEKILDVKPDVMLVNPKVFYSRIHPSDKKKLREAEYKAFMSRSNFTIEVRFVQDSGKEIWLYFNAIPQPIDERSAYYIGVVVDITERKKAEQALQQALDNEILMNKELSLREEELTQREEELRQTNQVLYEKNEELSKANEELDRFVYSASHDLRAPIASVLGLINLCKESNDLNEIYKYIELQERSIKKLDNFIQDILDYSQNTRLEIKRELIPLKKFIKDVFVQYSFLEFSAKIKKSILIKQNARFYTDKQRIAIILNNLISNAIRYINMYEPKPFVEVTVEVEQDYAYFVVKDNGIGIGKEHLDKVFEMFYRATTQKTGSGLGLYIVKETVQKLNGDIHISSELERGTTVEIRLPNLLNKK